MARLNVRKRGDKWEYRFEGATINGKRKQYTKSGFTNRRAAQKAGTQAMNEYNRTGNVFVQSEISFNDYLKTWFDVICEAKLNKQTKANYQKKLRLYILPELGKYKISSLTPPLLQKFINKLYDSKMSRNTLSVIKSILSSSLSYAVEPLNYISSNPMAYVQLPSKRLATVNSKTQPHYLISEEDMLRIFERFPETSSTHIPMMLGYKCGLRLGEAYGLCWNDVDLINKTISINRQIQWDDSEKRCWYFSNPKYDSFRTITIDDGLTELLRREKQRQEEYRRFLKDKFVCWFEDKDGILNNEHRGKKIHPVCIRNDGSYIQPRTMQHTSMIIHKKLGINFTFHSLRHTHCSMLLSAGAKPKYVQERLGHKNIQITLGIYQHLTNEMKEEGDDILNDIFDYDA